MNSLSVFQFNTSSIRVVSDNPLKPFFVASDVAKALGYKNPKQAILDRCKGSVKRLPLKTAGGVQKVRVIDEANLYRLIFGSKLKTAQAFQDWVFEEVLPAIRKTGKYEAPKEPQSLTKTQAGHIYNVVMAICHNQGRPYQSVFGDLKRKFNRSSYKDIDAKDYPAVCAYLDVDPLEGEYLEADTSKGNSHEDLEWLYRGSAMVQQSYWSFKEAETRMREALHIVEKTAPMLYSTGESLMFSTNGLDQNGFSSDELKKARAKGRKHTDELLWPALRTLSIH